MFLSGSSSGPTDTPPFQFSDLHGKAEGAQQSGCPARTKHWKHITLQLGGSRCGIPHSTRLLPAPQPPGHQCGRRPLCEEHTTQGPGVCRRPARGRRAVSAEHGRAAAPGPASVRGQTGTERVLCAAPRRPRTQPQRQDGPRGSKDTGDRAPLSLPPTSVLAQVQNPNTLGRSTDFFVVQAYQTSYITD